MVKKQVLRSAVAAFSLALAFPALASAHSLSVSVGPSTCVTPLNGSYTATVTITEQYFGGTTEDIPFGQDVYEQPSSTDAGNQGKLNQNYFTQGAVGTQTGPVNLGQPTSFTSPSPDSPTTQQFTVTTSVPETYVLGNGYMASPSSATITAPASGCATATILPAPTTYPVVCRASTLGYTVRAGQVNTIVVSVTRNGAAGTRTQVRISLPGGKTVSKRTGRNGQAIFTVAPTQSGTIIVRSPSCQQMIKVRVYAAKVATAVRAPSFTG